MVGHVNRRETGKPGKPRETKGKPKGNQGKPGTDTTFPYFPSLLSTTVRNRRGGGFSRIQLVARSEAEVASFRGTLHGNVNVFINIQRTKVALYSGGSAVSGFLAS